MSTSEPMLFVGSYAAPSEPGIHAFSFDDGTGNLNAMGSFAGIAHPSFVVVHPNGRWLYTVSETGQQSGGAPGAVWALDVEQEPFSIRPLNHQPSSGDWPCHLQIDATGKWLFVSNYGSGSAGVLPILSNGALGDLADLVQHHGSGPNPERQESPHAHSTTLTPDNRFAIVADLGIDQLVFYEFDPSTGKFRHHSHTHTRPGAGPRHLAFHPNGEILYVANELDNTVAVYDYYGSSGSLREKQVLATVPPDTPGNTVADIHISTSAKRVYVSNRGHNSIAVFDADAEGRLTHVAYASCSGNWPRNFALSPGGGYMLVANQYSDDVSVLPLLSGAEEIAAPVTRLAVPKPSCIRFAPAHD